MINQITLEDLKTIIQEECIDYMTAKLHSKKVDELLGFKCEEIENKLRDHSPLSVLNPSKKFWVGLDTQIFQTPYSEIIEMIKHIDPNNHELWIDLGAAYGRMGIVLSLYKPQMQFIGYEMVEERVNEGNRIFNKLNISAAKLFSEDIASSDFILKEADLYFIYDFGSRDDIYQILDKLKAIASKRSIKVVARGRGVRQWIMQDCPWLSQIKTPMHFDHWSLFIS